MLIGRDIIRPTLSATAVLDPIEISVPLEGLSDVEVEQTRLTRELKKLEEDVMRSEAKLARATTLRRRRTMSSRKRRPNIDNCVSGRGNWPWHWSPCNEPYDISAG